MLKLIHSGVTDLNRMAALFNLYSGTFKVIGEEIFIFEVYRTLFIDGLCDACAELPCKYSVTVDISIIIKESNTY